MESNLEFSSQAFCKMVMHAMKYPQFLCSGLLLAPKPDTASDEDEEQDEKRGQSNKLSIVEAIPVSHASQCLAPNVEIAFNSVRMFAQEQELVICGYYQTGRDPFSTRVTDKIGEYFPNPILCFVILDEGQSSLDPHQLVGGKWKRKSAQVAGEDLNNILFSKDRLYKNLVDFDEHFNNISLDWTNARISQRIDHLIANVF